MTREQTIMQVAWNSATTTLHNADYHLSNCYHGNGDEHDKRINEMRELLKKYMEPYNNAWPEFHKTVYKDT